MRDADYQKMRRGWPIVADFNQQNYNQSAINLLRRVEWTPTCPFCHRLEAHGHSPNCDLGQFFLKAGLKVRFYSSSKTKKSGRYTENGGT